MEWYIIHTLSGYEKKVRKLLEENIDFSSIQDQFGEILIPMENVSVIQRGERKIIERQLYPGYILIQMNVTDNSYQLVTRLPGVMGFLGSGTHPQSVTEKEMKQLLSSLEEEKVTVSSEVPYQKGESIKVVQGPFTDFTGTVEEIYPQRGKLKVMVTIFGRATKVELDFVQVKGI
ncbi:transcription termination/antitermination factor NusG [candidate division TA06 bacterium]|nr:transcription termination/antitermination factor NusG [candidate division TA06 bacterium]